MPWKARRNPLKLACPKCGERKSSVCEVVLRDTEILRYRICNGKHRFKTREVVVAALGSKKVVPQT